MGGIQDKIMVDSNVLFDLYCKTERLKIVEGVVLEKELYLSQAVFYELGSLLKKFIGSKLASVFLEDIKDTCYILSLSDEQENKALQVMQKYQFNNPHKEYTLTDAVQLVQAHEYSLTLYTSDEAMSWFQGASVEHI
jgi:predicted nucleic acid-binding protein